MINTLNVFHQIDIFVYSFALLIGIYLLTYKYLKASKLPVKFVKVTTFLILTQSVLEALGAILLVLKIPATLSLIRFLYFIAFIVCGTLSVSLLQFCCDFVISDRKIADMLQKMAYGALIIDVPLLIINYYYGFMFKITDNMIFVRGPFYLTHYLILFATGGVLCICGVILSKNLPKDSIIVCLIILTLYILAISLEFILHADTFINITNSICASILLIVLRATHTTLNPVTKIFNKTTFVEKLREIEQTNPNYTLILLDIDNISEINKKYGFQEGNSCLTMISKLLKKSVSEKSIIGSGGGDEFLIYFDEAHIDVDLNELMLEMSSFVRNNCIAYNKDYSASFTYVIESFDKSKYYSSSELIEHMYYDLYKEKETHYS